MFSASSEARDRNAPTNANQIRLQTFRIGQEHRPIRYQLPARLSFRQGQEHLHELMPWSGASPLPKPGEGALKPQGGKDIEDAVKGANKSWLENLFGRPAEGEAKPQSFLQGPPITLKPQPITLNLNVDGRRLAETVSENQVNPNEHPTQAPAADGAGQFYGGDHNWPDH